MSEFCLDSSPSMPKKSHDLSRIVLSDFYLLCSFIFSHPLYLSYFLFFSPHLYKIFSFLSPLFVTTSLLLLALLTVSPGLLHDNNQHHNVQDKTDDVEFRHFEFEELEVYKIVFERPSFEVREENPCEVLEVKAQEEAYAQAFEDFEEETVDKCMIEVGKTVSEVPTCNSETTNNSGTISDEALWLEIDQKFVSEVPTCNSETKNSSDTISGEALWQEIDQKIVSEVPTGNSETKNISGTISDEAWCLEIDQKIVSEVPTCNSDTISGEALCPEIDRNIEGKGGVENLSWEREQIEEKEVKQASAESNKVAKQPLKSNGSKANSNDHGTRFESFNRAQDQYKTHPNFDPTLGSSASMRKEKEWKRTLACKLFEERHNSGGVGAEGGMDMLWETYEAESSKNPKKGSRGVAESYEDEDEEEDDGAAAQLCCLQALKFSSGKMNLGMRRPSLVKFSKALKGMGWLHHVSKASRKVYR